ncbi:MAG: homoserine dehydrogenase [Anaerolineae bacterium]|nr:MAG: homoserine dehydrogenase [Anaerolineae bacterium]
MTHYKLAFIGFGNVGRALARLLLDKQADIQKQYGITYSTVAIATGRHGAAIQPAGIDLEQAITVKDFNALSERPAPTDMLTFIKECGADVLFENSPVSYADGEPALSHLRATLQAGMHASTANKGPVVHGYHELRAIAEQHGVKFFHESTVMDGAPLFSTFRAALPAARLLRFTGILNSTTNLMLSRMENGESFDEAVAYAQSIGIAETDPSGDVDGWDASIKVAALTTVLMDVPFKPQDVDRTGIRAITPEDIAAAKAEGKRWKLLCRAERMPEGVKAKVWPEKVGPETPFYQIDGTTSIVQFETDVLGRLSIIEENPGPHTTAYGLLADFLNAVR